MEPRPSALRRETFRPPPVSSAARADFDQTIEPRLVLLDPSSESVFIGVNRLNPNLVTAYYQWLSMADESLRIAMFLRLGCVNNSRRR
jgi:hypothetical protein